MSYGFTRMHYGIQVDENTFLIIEDREIIYGEAPDEFVRFIGSGQMREDTELGVAAGTVTFVLKNASTIEEAFEQAPLMFETVKKQQLSLWRRRMIAQPGKMPVPAGPQIVIP